MLIWITETACDTVYFLQRLKILKGGLRIMKTKKIITFLFVTIFIMAIATSVSFASRKIVVSGGGIGSTTNLVISAVANIAQNYCDLLPTVIINPTSAQQDFLERREVDIATVTGYLSYDAYNGLGRYEGKPFKELRSLVDRPNAQLQVVVLGNSSIREISDLIGKNIIFGKTGSASATYGEAMFEALGIFDDLKPLYLPWGDTQAKLLTGQGDAVLIAGTYPHSALTELSLTHRDGIRYVPFSEEEVDTIIEYCPYLVPVTMPPFYKGMEEDTLTLEYVNIVCCVDLSEEEAYCLTKSFWENLDQVALNWEALGRLTLEGVSQIKRVAPWHIGTYKYYKEMGLEIPSEMVPPEAK